MEKTEPVEELCKVPVLGRTSGVEFGIADGFGFVQTKEVLFQSLWWLLGDLDPVLQKGDGKVGACLSGQPKTVCCWNEISP